MTIKNNIKSQAFIGSAVLFSSLAMFSITASAEISSTDWDNDGISDVIEERLGTEIYLSDTDGDGISDKDELGDVTEPRDTDGDGRIDALDIDDDGDNIPTILEGKGDADKDGRENHLDKDSDGDGLEDGYEVQLTGMDSDNDGLDDYFDSDRTGGVDENGDGVVDTLVLIDSDKDGVPDLLDKDSKVSHAKQPKASEAATDTVKAEAEPEKAAEEKKEESVVAEAEEKSAVVVSAPDLPQLNIKREHSYTEAKPEQAGDNSAYGGTGYFYCANSGKIVPGIKGFMLTPPGKIKLLRDATQGDYHWKASEPGTYALQFQIPQGMSIVRGLAKGRRIVKQGDADPLILGGEENPTKKGYLMQSSTGSNNWHTSFEIKDGAPQVRNNNIPLSGGLCEQP